MIEKPSIILTGGSGLLSVNWFYSKREEYSIHLGLNNRIINPLGGNVFKIDYDTIENLTNQLNKIKPELVINTVGLTSIEKCEENPELAYLINVELSRKVAEATKKLNIPLVHISTDHLFDGTTSMVNEDQTINTINVYGFTKAEAEKIVMKINPNTLIIRTNFYGWGTSYRKSFSDVIINSLRNNENLNLFCDIYYTPILAERLIQIVHELTKKKAKGIFNIASDNRISKYEFGVLIAEEFNLNKLLINKISIIDKLNLVKRPKDMSLSNKKLSEYLGISIGSVKEHITRLREQEFESKTKEIQLL
jgi:dTDP-4-dehydrorhamnose reductase